MFSLLHRPDPVSGGVGVAFTDRHGGVSVGPMGSLNLGRTDVDDIAAVTENFERVRRALGVRALVTTSQVHGTAVHRVDAAEAFCLALEKGRPGSVFHPVAEEGVPFRDIAGALAKKLGLPVVSKPTEGEAQQFFGPLSFAYTADNPTSGARTREQLGWNPVHPTLLEDIENDVYSTLG